MFWMSRNADQWHDHDGISKNKAFWKSYKDKHKDNKVSNDKEENKDLGEISTVQLCEVMDNLMGDNDA